MNDRERTLYGPEEIAYILEQLPKLSGHLIENAREPYEKWAAGFCTDVEGLIEELQAEVERLRTALEAVIGETGPWPTKIAKEALGVRE